MPEQRNIPRFLDQSRLAWNRQTSGPDLRNGKRFLPLGGFELADGKLFLPLGGAELADDKLFLPLGGSELADDKLSCLWVAQRFHRCETVPTMMGGFSR